MPIRPSNKTETRKQDLSDLLRHEAMVLRKRADMLWRDDPLLATNLLRTAAIAARTALLRKLCQF